MKLYLTAFLLLFVNQIDIKDRLSPKQERIMIERRLDNSEKEILEITRIINEISILKN